MDGQGQALLGTAPKLTFSQKTVFFEFEDPFFAHTRLIH